MNTTRRQFLKKTSILATGLGLSKPVLSFHPTQTKLNPIVVSTWDHGMAANEAAWKVLIDGGYALDAVEAGVRVPEGDPNVITVGYGGFPDKKGKVTLDACIMDEKGSAGSVAFLQHIKHPISVARLVMETTPHVMLVGKGACKFALKNGFPKEKLLTPKMKKEWKKWKKQNREFKPIINIENEEKVNHDTIGMLALDSEGRLAGACTTSGMAYKMHGRVGDSPIIGAGLYVDGDVGGAVATGSGELVMKTLGSFLVVELMRNGMSPKEACLEAVQRIVQKIPGYEEHQIGYLALNKKGEYGSFSMQRRFDVAIKTNEISELKESEAYLKER